VKKCFGTLAVLAALLALFATRAAAVTVGTYQLHNHPNGGISPPLYGLRLDGLLGDPAREYTFDFDHPGSNMTLVWDGNTIVIGGQAYGGEDTGGSYTGAVIWDIRFEYSVGISQSANGGVDDLLVHANNLNFGTITSSLGSFELEDYADSSGLSFQFGDEGGSGHRGEPGLSGWGWLNHGADCITQNCTHTVASDWLFTASPVPVPAAVWLFGSGLIGLLGLARLTSTRP